MATITKPMALDESFNTTETNPRSIADVLAEMGEAISQGMGRTANEVAYDNTTSGLSADDVQEAVDELAAEKVDKVTGKGLSTNDYTDAEKSKLAGIEAGAQVNPTIDSELSDSSTNAVQNKVVKDALDGKADNADVAGTQSVSGNPITLTDASETYAQSLVVELEPIQEGSGDPSPTNIRPITGYTECEVEDVGFNQWDEEWELGTHLSGQLVSSTTRIRNKYPIKVLPNTTYYIKCSTPVYVMDVNASSGWTQYNSRLVQDGLFTTTEWAEYIYFSPQEAYGTTYNHDICINISKTEGTPKNGDYVPYHSSNATIQFGQTVYGGKVDFLTGVLTVDRASVDCGDITWTRTATNISGKYRFSKMLDPIGKQADTAHITAICSHYKLLEQGGTSTAYNDGFTIASDGNMLFYIADYDAYTTDQFKAAMDGIQVCYELTTPIVIQLTPQELQLLKQYNNLSTNGTTINLDYIPNNSIGDAVKASEEYTNRQVNREIEKHLEMPYLRILDNDVDTEVKNYRLYYRMIASAYTLVNLAEMLQHRFLFVEVVQNPSGTSNDKLLHSALIDPRTIDGYEYQMKAGTGDTVCIKTNIAENKLDLYVQSTGTHTSGDPTDYYVTIRLVD